MEELKYYQPEIEEFHIGFEYEWLHSWGEWKKTEVHPGGFTVGNVKLETLRVKCLDREDIESFSFKFRGYDRDGRTHYYYVLDNKVVLNDYRDYGYEDIQIYLKGGKVVFQGIIKNKSELKRLLKQLEII